MISSHSCAAKWVLWIKWISADYQIRCFTIANFIRCIPRQCMPDMCFRLNTVFCFSLHFLWATLCNYLWKYERENVKNHLFTWIHRRKNGEKSLYMENWRKKIHEKSLYIGESKENMKNHHFFHHFYKMLLYQE